MTLSVSEMVNDPSTYTTASENSLRAPSIEEIVRGVKAMRDLGRTPERQIEWKGMIHGTISGKKLSASAEFVAFVKENAVQREAVANLLMPLTGIPIEIDSTYPRSTAGPRMFDFIYANGA